MSRATEAEPDPEGWDSLRDVFHKEISENGGDSARAFIATLDELDARMAVTDERVAQNTLLFETLIKWLKATDDRIKGIPGRIEDGTAKAADRLSVVAERGAAAGAREGAAPAQHAMEALWAAVQGYEARIRRIARLAALGLPVAFSAALLAAFLFAGFVIPALPREWQWPCTLIGAEFRTSVDPDSLTTFCVIVRE